MAHTLLCRILGMKRRSVFRSEDMWEVIENRSVEPVPMFYDDERKNVGRIAYQDTNGTYVFDLPRSPGGAELHQALMFARQQLLSQISKQEYNCFLLEGWQVNVLRRGSTDMHRIHVSYNGRPAYATGNLSLRLPPYIGLVAGTHIPPSP